MATQQPQQQLTQQETISILPQCKPVNHAGTVIIVWLIVIVVLLLVGLVLVPKEMHGVVYMGALGMLLFFVINQLPILLAMR